MHGEGRIALLNVDSGLQAPCCNDDGSGSLPAFDTSGSEGQNRFAQGSESVNRKEAGPILLLLDEPLTGISPSRIDAIASSIRSARESGTTVCLIEHIVSIALGVADKVYILQNGRMRFEGNPDDFSENEFVQKVYLAG